MSVSDVLRLASDKSAPSVLSPGLNYRTKGEDQVRGQHLLQRREFEWDVNNCAPGRQVTPDKPVPHGSYRAVGSGLRGLDDESVVESIIRRPFVRSCNNNDPSGTQMLLSESQPSSRVGSGASGLGRAISESSTIKAVGNPAVPRVNSNSRNKSKVVGNNISGEALVSPSSCDIHQKGAMQANLKIRQMVDPETKVTGKFGASSRTTKITPFTFSTAKPTANGGYVSTSSRRTATGMARIAPASSSPSPPRTMKRDRLTTSFETSISSPGSRPLGNTSKALIGVEQMTTTSASPPKPESLVDLYSTNQQMMVISSSSSHPQHQELLLSAFDDSDLLTPRTSNGPMLLKSIRKTSPLEPPPPPQMAVNGNSSNLQIHDDDDEDGDDPINNPLLLPSNGGANTTGLVARYINNIPTQQLSMSQLSKPSTSDDVLTPRQTPGTATYSGFSQMSPQPKSKVRNIPAPGRMMSPTTSSSPNRFASPTTISSLQGRKKKVLNNSPLDNKENGITSPSTATTTASRVVAPPSPKVTQRRVQSPHLNNRQQPATETVHSSCSIRNNPLPSRAMSNDLARFGLPTNAGGINTKPTMLQMSTTYKAPTQFSPEDLKHLESITAPGGMTDSFGSTELDPPRPELSDDTADEQFRSRLRNQQSSLISQKDSLSERSPRSPKGRPRTPLPTTMMMVASRKRRPSKAIAAELPAKPTSASPRARASSPGFRRIASGEQLSKHGSASRLPVADIGPRIMSRERANSPPGQSTFAAPLQKQRSYMSPTRRPAVSTQLSCSKWKDVGSPQRPHMNTVMSTDLHSRDFARVIDLGDMEDDWNIAPRVLPLAVRMGALNINA